MHQAIKTESAFHPRGHYSQAVQMGSWLFISGQLPFDPEGNAVKGTMAEECAQALKNVRVVLDAAQGKLSDVIQCTLYLSDITLWAEVEAIYGAFFAEVPVLPARTVVPVKEMHFGARIEIQAVAFLTEH